MKGLNKNRLCKCGHNHISYLGEDARNGEGYYRINECEECKCENFKEKKK